jgi:NAD(P)H-hydrate repair Nnr-like enzyme with NAD(P)H-hydrate dehydratase domain
MDITKYTSQIRRMDPDSHKGQNGKVMVIGGSELFHAASRWALDVVSSMVDMVFYSSTPENNELIHEAKQNFWNGVVVPRGEVDNYIQEADVILIGPGMTREDETSKITNRLVAAYPDKKWVIDAGALQLIDPSLLNKSCIVTPHKAEFLSLCQSAGKLFLEKQQFEKDENQYKTRFEIPGAGGWTIGVKDLAQKDGDWLWYEEDFEQYLEKYMKEVDTNDPEAEWTMGKFRGNFISVSAVLRGTTVLRKGKNDFITRYHTVRSGQGLGNAEDDFEIVTGGNPGMTKGGTGDALAGLVAGLYAYTDDPFAAAVVASYVNKKSGDELYTSVGPFFTTNQLVEQIPKELKKLLY